MTDLTPRERAVLHRACNGLSNKQIAEELCVTTKTVESHIDRARKRVGVETVRRLLVEFALWRDKEVAW
jgi:DNA-binding NarL/FixJ family response regulator